MKKINKYYPRVKQCFDCGVSNTKVFRSLKYDKDYCTDCLTSKILQDITSKETE